MSIVAGSICFLLHHVEHAVIRRSFVCWAEDDVCSAEVCGRIESLVDAQSLGGSHEADEHTEEAAPDVDQFASSPSVHFAPALDVLNCDGETVTWHRREHAGQSTQGGGELM